MNRAVATQLVLMIAVLAMLVRWIPGDDVRDALGRGEPALILRMDAQLADYADDLPRRAYLKALRFKAPDLWFRRWKKLLGRVDEIRAEAGPDTLVQFKAMPRNLLWPLMYELYPIPTTFTYYEEGSREDDPTLPGAIVMEGNLLRAEAMTPRQLEAFQKMQDGLGRYQGVVVEDDG